MPDVAKILKELTDYSELESDAKVVKWLKYYSSRNARRQRLGILSRFCEWSGKSPTELINEKKADDKLEEPTEDPKFQLHAYFKYLTEEAPKEKRILINSARRYVYSVLAGLYKKNLCPVMFQRGEVPAEEPSQKGDWTEGEKGTEERQAISKYYKKDVLKRIRDNFDLIRDKGILCAKLSSGMDDVDLFILKVGDLWRGFDKKTRLCYITGNRKKDRMRFQTCFNSEATELLHDYLKRRETKGETITEDSWLLVSKFPDSEGKPKRIKDNAFSVNLKECITKLKIEGITPKELRVYFEDLMDDGGFPETVVKRMMGHVVESIADYKSYFRSKESFIEYLLDTTNHKHYNDLTSLGNMNHFRAEMGSKMEEMNESIILLREQVSELITEKTMKVKIMGEDEIPKIDKEGKRHIGLTEEEEKQLGMIQKETEEDIDAQIIALQEKKAKLKEKGDLRRKK